MFDAAADRQKKQADERRKEARKRLLKQQQDDAKAKEMAAQREAKEVEFLRQKRLAEEEREERLYRTGGVFFEREFLVVPDSRGDDKLVLPQSVFASLEEQKVFENSGVLTFELEVVGDGDVDMVGESAATSSSSSSLAADQQQQQQENSFLPGSREQARTHCGVAEFTADEGTVRFGPKVLFSLAHDRHKGGKHESARVEKVKIRFVRLFRHNRCRCVFQPKGGGFFGENNDQEVVDINLKAVLETQLRFHTCLSEGDIIPVRHEGRTYFLQAKLLEPDEALLLLDTEMEIDVLPSEQVEFEEKLAKIRAERAERLAKERALAVEKRAAAADEERARRRKWDEEQNSTSSSSTSTSTPSNTTRTVDIQVKLPNGKTVSRTFSNPETATLSRVFQWLENTEITMEFTWTASNPALPFELVQSWPGHRRVFGKDKELDETLSKLGLNGRREQLFWKQMGAAETTEESTGGTEATTNPAGPPGASTSSTGNVAANPSSKTSSPTEQQEERPTVPRLPTAWRDAGEQAFAQIDTQKVVEDVDMSSASSSASTSGGLQADGGSSGLGGTNNNDLAAQADATGTGSSTGQQKEKIDTVAIFHLLRASEGNTNDPQEDAALAQKWGAQLLQLADLGFGPELWLSRCIPLLKKWNGHMPRVMNSLMMEGE